MINRCEAYTYMIGFSASIILLIFGGTMLHEYLKAKDFEATECTPVNITNYGHVECKYSISTGKSAYTKSSKMLCVQVRVSYNDQEGVTREGTLYATVLTIGMHSDPCSYSKCGADVNASDAEVLQFVKPLKEKLAQSSDATNPVPCYYQANSYKDLESNSLIAEKVYSRAAAVNAVFWPMLILVILLIVIPCRLRCDGAI